MEDKEITTEVSENNTETDVKTDTENQEILDKKEELNTINTNEDDGDGLSLEELFKTIEAQEVDKKEEKDDFYSSESHSKQLEELNSQLGDLNSKLSEKDTLIQDFTSKLDMKEKELKEQEEVLKKADELWTKITENQGLYDLVQKYLNGEDISIGGIIQNKLLEDLDVVPNTTDTSSSQVPPEGDKSLQDRLMGTRITYNR